MKGIGIFLIIVAFVCFGLGIYKYAVYENPDSYFLDHKNVYVGGDSYNYIINANYFTGFSVLGACAFLSGVILIAAENIIEAIKRKES